MMTKQQRLENLSLLAFQAKMYYSVKRGAPLLYDCCRRAGLQESYNCLLFQRATSLFSHAAADCPVISRLTGPRQSPRRKAELNKKQSRQDSPPCHPDQL